MAVSVPMRGSDPGDTGNEPHHGATRRPSVSLQQSRPHAWGSGGTCPTAEAPTAAFWAEGGSLADPGVGADLPSESEGPLRGNGSNAGWAPVRVLIHQEMFLEQTEAKPGCSCSPRLPGWPAMRRLGVERPPSSPAPSTTGTEAARGRLLVLHEIRAVSVLKAFPEAHEGDKHAKVPNGSTEMGPAEFRQAVMGSDG